MFLQWKNSEGCFASGRSTEDEIIQNFLIDSSLGTSQSQETWLWLQPSKRNCLHILKEYFLLNILPGMETVINVWLFRYLFHIKGPMVSLWRGAIFCQGNAFEGTNEGNYPARVSSLSSARGFLPNTNTDFNKWRKWSYLLAYSPSAFLFFLSFFFVLFYQ